jgi:hypothetical protein
MPSATGTADRDGQEVRARPVPVARPSRSRAVEAHTVQAAIAQPDDGDQRAWDTQQADEETVPRPAPAEERPLRAAYWERRLGRLRVRVRR